MADSGIIQITVQNGNVVSVDQIDTESQKKLVEGTDYTVYYPDYIKEKGVEEYAVNSSIA